MKYIYVDIYISKLLTCLHVELNIVNITVLIYYYNSPHTYKHSNDFRMKQNSYVEGNLK